MNARAVTLVLAVTTVFLWHSKVWPKRVCPNCKGGGETGPQKSTARRDCWRCHGTKRIPRWFAWIPWPVVLTITAATAIGVLAA